MEPVPKVGNVVITTAKGMKYLPALLSSIARQTYADHETTAVVDGGDRAVVEYLEGEWPELHVVPIAEAGGFARAIDSGVRSSRGEYIGILNDDVELEPDWLALLVAELDRDPDVGFATGKTMLYDDRDLINEANQDVYSCGRFVPRGLLEKDVGQYDEPGPTTVASASASVYRRAAVVRAGGFDTDYGIYCEDADLCLRMILSGYRGRYVPAAVAYHAWSPTVGRTSETSLLLGNRNMLATLFKDFPAPVLARSLPKIVRYQWWTYRSARATHWARTLLRAWIGFLGMLPATLRKRRRLQSRRAISSREFEAFLLTGYPDLPPVQRDPAELRRFSPARLRLVALDIRRRRRMRGGTGSSGQ
ncbi:MAG TPA: glycosyltransferase family 2 protein [Solirubrobacterales bacterium]|nr:glycosyltransferase family 2 protein [Solirubrobacterales bacterium]